MNVLGSIGQMPTWVIIILGWYVVHHFTLKRDERKEARERIDVFLKSVRSLEQKAVAFHQCDQHQGDVARDLRYDIQRLICSLKRHPFPKFSVSSEVLKEVRKSITFRNFDATAFVPQDTHSQIIADIASAMDELEDQVERGYEEVFINRSWRSRICKFLANKQRG